MGEIPILGELNLMKRQKTALEEIYLWIWKPPCSLFQATENIDIQDPNSRII